MTVWSVWDSIGPLTGGLPLRHHRERRVARRAAHGFTDRDHLVLMVRRQRSLAYAEWRVWRTTSSDIVTRNAERQRDWVLPVPTLSSAVQHGRRY